MLKSLPTLSAHWPMPYRRVGYSSPAWVRQEAVAAHGMILMDSVPPAMATSRISPRSWRPVAMVSSPEEQKRLMVSPEMVSGSPAASNAMRPDVHARFRLGEGAPDDAICSISAGTPEPSPPPDRRCRQVVWTNEGDGSCPIDRPTAVRTAETIYTFSML